MKNIKKYVWIAVIVFILVVVSGYFGWNAFSKRVVDNANKEAGKLNIEIGELKNKIKLAKQERNDVLIEKSEIEKRYEDIKANPPIKKVPIIKYKTIKEIQYVKSDDYKFTLRALNDCNFKFDKAIRVFDDLDINYNTYIFKTEKIEEKTKKIETKIEKKSDVFEGSMKLLAPRNRSIHASLSISALGGEVGLYNLNDTMQFYKIPPPPDTIYLSSPGLDTTTKAVKFGYVFYFLKIEASLFRKDIIRKDLFK